MGSGLTRLGVRIAREAGGLTDGVADKAGRDAAETGIQRAEQDLIESGVTRGGRTAVSETNPVDALRRLKSSSDPEQVTKFVDDRHREVVEGLSAARNRAKQIRGTDPTEAANLDAQIRGFETELRMYRAHQQVESVGQAVEQLGKEGTEGAQRDVVQHAGRVYNSYAESLLGVGRVDDAVAHFTAAAEFYGRAAGLDLGARAGRPWGGDLKLALRAAGRGGDVEQALRISGAEERVGVAQHLVHGAVSETEPAIRQNMLRVARGLVDDVRSRPVSLAEGLTIGARAPLTDIQWVRIQRRITGRDMPSQVEDFIIRQDYVGSDIVRLTGEARDRAIASYADNAGQSAGYASDEAILASLGYARTQNSPPGVLRFDREGAMIELPAYPEGRHIPFTTEQREALTQAIRNGQHFGHPDVGRVAAEARERLIVSYADDAGHSAGYASDEAVLASLGYTRAQNSPLGVVRFRHEGGSVIEFPIHQGNSVPPFAPGQRDALAQAIRNRQSFIHPDVGRVAFETRERVIVSYAGDAGHSAGYASDEATLAGLGYTRAQNSRPGVARFEHEGGTFIEFPVHQGNSVTPFAPGQRDLLAQAIRNRQSFTHPDVGRVAAEARDRAIVSYADDAGRSAGYASDEAALARLGYTQAQNSPPGVVRFRHEGGSVIEFPVHQGNSVTPFAAGQRDALAQAIRNRQSFIHPDVGRVAAEARERAIVSYADDAGQSAGYTSDQATLARLGYTRSQNAPSGVVRFEHEGGTLIEFPVHQGGRATPFAPGERDALAQAIRNQQSYTHPDV